MPCSTRCGSAAALAARCHGVGATDIRAVSGRTETRRSDLAPHHLVHGETDTARRHEQLLGNCDPYGHYGSACDVPAFIAEERRNRLSASGGAGLHRESPMPTSLSRIPQMDA